MMQQASRRKPNHRRTTPDARVCAAADAVSVPAPETRPWTLAIIAAIVVSACASGTGTGNAPKYVEPPKSSPTARVRVVNTRPFAYYAAIAIFDAASCFDRATLGMTGGDSKDSVRIGMLDSKPPSSASIERRVNAGEPLVIGPRAVFPVSSMGEIMHALMPEAQDELRARQAGVCRIPSFTPKVDEQYEVLVDLTPAHCSVKPYRLVDSGGAVQREEVPSQLSQISTYEFDMKCFK